MVPHSHRIGHPPISLSPLCRLSLLHLPLSRSLLGCYIHGFRWGKKARDVPIGQEAGDDIGHIPCISVKGVWLVSLGFYEGARQMRPNFLTLCVTIILRNTASQYPCIIGSRNPLMRQKMNPQLRSTFGGAAQVSLYFCQVSFVPGISKAQEYSVFSREGIIDESE
jgi:hypothetical protein